MYSFYYIQERFHLFKDMDLHSTLYQGHVENRRIRAWVMHLVGEQYHSRLAEIFSGNLCHALTRPDFDPTLQCPLHCLSDPGTVKNQEHIFRFSNK